MDDLGRRSAELTSGSLKMGFRPRDAHTDVPLYRGVSQCRLSCSEALLHCATVERCTTL